MFGAYDARLVMWSLGTRWLFGNAAQMVRVGRSRPLVAADTPELDAELEPRTVPPAFEGLVCEPFGPFITRLFFAAGRPARAIVALTFVRLLLVLSSPFLLEALLEGLPEAQRAASYPIGLLGLALVFGLAGIASGLAAQHWFNQGLRARTVIVNAINQRIVTHALRLRRSARARMGTGDLVNHLGSDTDAVAEVGFFLPEALHAGLLISAAFTALISYLGWAATAALLAMLVMAPLTARLGRRFRRLDHQIMEIRDERTTLMSQLLHGIRVVKYHAWEQSLRAEVQAVRGREIATRLQLHGTDVMASAFWVGTSTVVALAAFGTHVLLGGTLTAPLVFPCLALFALLEEPFGFISHILARAQHARVAAARLHAYFSAPVRPEDERPLSPAGVAIGVRADAIAMQYEGAPVASLETTTLEVPAGAAVAIVGPVGSGKSTLLRLLGSIQVPSSGRVEHGTGARPRIAYVPQEAFILNASVRDNVRFGAVVAGDGVDADDAAITAIARDCALGPDLAAMPSGLDTEIGERGVNLSGGQKQRVALARAAYHQPGLLLLDDPLSAVDVETERVLIERLLFGRLRGVTRVVATHRLAHLARFDHVVLLDGGRIVAQGRHAELLESPVGSPGTELEFAL